MTNVLNIENRRKNQLFHAKCCLDSWEGGIIELKIMIIIITEKGKPFERMGRKVKSLTHRYSGVMIVRLPRLFSAVFLFSKNGWRQGGRYKGEK